MNQKEIDFLNLENELLNTRRKLNDLIYAFSQENPASENQALYKEKIYHLEAELKYMNDQLQMMKQSFNEADIVETYSNIQPKAIQPQTVQTRSLQPQFPQPDAPQETQQEVQNYNNIQVNTVPNITYRNTQDYEKIFGKNFMGVFASVLIFISLIIFATLVLPYLSNTIKLIGLYIVSFAILSAGLALYKRNTSNKFYIALIGCGVGALYITLLLSDLYFKVIGDITLYIFILVWAALVKYLTKYKNLVFTIIGQAGIFISSILGTALCVREQDIGKFFVLVVFYLIAACVFSNFSRDYLQFLMSGKKDDLELSRVQFFYEDNLCSHICKPLNIIVFMLGFTAFIKPGGFELTSIFLLMFYLLFEYYFAYKEICRNGIAFEILTIVNSILLVCLFNVTHVLNKDYSFLLMYIVSIVVLFYVNNKKTTYTIISEICCFIMVLIGSNNNTFISNHLYAYLTVIPFMIYGKIKDKKTYLYAGTAYLADFLCLIMLLSSNYFLKLEILIMIFAAYAVFLYVCRNLRLPAFKIAGYLALCLIMMYCVDDASHYFMGSYNMTQHIGIKAYLISFFVIAVIHLILNKLEYFGKELSVEIMMYIVTALLMIIGCTNMYREVWQFPLILLTTLLFTANSKRLLTKHEYVGYYIAFKYTVLTICILTSYHAVDYVISICLLIFAIASIIAGFYKDTISFRLYGLVLSMISIIKLIIIDIHYDSTIENAVSFFVSGVLCFIISFIYHKIDITLRKKEE